eukprot:evm.model.scf_943.4 EVM.evm.TU.scf_943.4   scf_943:43869-44177(+)
MSCFASFSSQENDAVSLGLGLRDWSGSSHSDLDACCEAPAKASAEAVLVAMGYPTTAVLNSDSLLVPQAMSGWGRIQLLKRHNIHCLCSSHVVVQLFQHCNQ